MVAVADPEALDDEPVLLGGRLLLVGRLRRDRTRPETGDRGDDLEDGSRDIAAERRARQQRLPIVGLERLPGRVGRGRICERRRVVGRGRGEGQDLAIARVEHHDRPVVVAERPDGSPLELERQREGQVLGVVGVGPELAQRVRDRVAGQARQLGVVGELQAGAPVAGRRVADDLADGGTPIHPVKLAVRVLLVACEGRPVPVADDAARHGPGRRDHGRVVGRADELGRLDHGPVAARRGQGTERDRQRQSHVHDRAAQRPAAGRRRQHQAVPRRRRRRQPVASLGGGGGSTPRSDSASSNPTTTAFASSDEPP